MPSQPRSQGIFFCVFLSWKLFSISEDGQTKIGQGTRLVTPWKPDTPGGFRVPWKILKLLDNHISAQKLKIHEIIFTQLKNIHGYIWRPTKSISLHVITLSWSKKQFWDMTKKYDQKIISKSKTLLEILKLDKLSNLIGWEHYGVITQELQFPWTEIFT